MMCICCCESIFAPVFMPIKRFRRRRFPAAMFLFLIVITIWTFVALNQKSKSFDKLDDDIKNLQGTAFQALNVKERMQDIHHAWGSTSIRGLKQGKVWTLLSCAFVHADFGHWMGNMVGMTVAGWKLNCLIGHLHFCLLFIITAVGASLMNLTIADPEMTLLGTSGVVFGLYGALFGVVVIYWSKFKSVRVSMTVMLSFMVIMEIWPYVLEWLRKHKGWERKGGADNVAHMAHLAGFAGGIMYVLAVQPSSWNKELSKVYAKRIGKMGQKIGMVLFTIFVLVPAAICIVRAVQL